MALKIETDKGVFDINNDFNVEIEISSPIYNEIGSRSIPVTLPATPNNKNQVGYIQRMDIVRKPEKKQIVISDGIYRRIGRQNITSANDKEGIVLNIGFDESEAYSLWKSVKLKSLPDLPEVTNDVDNLVNELESVFLGNKEADYSVFQIIVANDSLTEDEKETFHPEILNKVISKDGLYGLQSDERTENCLINGSLVETKLPNGYGVTAFLKVNWIVEKIFSSYGYTLLENPFSSHPALKKMVVLNNIADMIVRGKLPYIDMLPDCTINEFFDSLFARTGMQIFIYGDTKTARIKLLKDIFTSSVGEDWSSFKMDLPNINFSEPQQLRLSAKTSISGAEPAAESLDSFLQPYNYVVSETDSFSLRYGYLFQNEAHLYYYKRNIVDSKPVRLSSCFFPWDRETPELDYVEISGEDECVPTDNYNEISTPYYLVGSLHRNTKIESTSKDLSDKDEKRETPLAFMFPVKKNYLVGSLICEDLSLTFCGEKGAFNRFFREYDAILRHANHTIEMDLNISSVKLLKVDCSIPISIDGQRLMIDTIKHSLPFRRSKPATAVFRTIKLLEPYDLTEQEVAIQRQLFYWELNSDREYWMDGITAELRRELAVNLGPNIMIENFKYVAIEETAPTDDDFSYLPPTQEEYDQKVKYYGPKAYVKFEMEQYLRKLENGILSYPYKNRTDGPYEVNYYVYIIPKKMPNT